MLLHTLSLSLTHTHTHTLSLSLSLSLYFFSIARRKPGTVTKAKTSSTLRFFKAELLAQLRDANGTLSVERAVNAVEATDVTRSLLTLV